MLVDASERPVEGSLEYLEILEPKEQSLGKRERTQLKCGEKINEK